MTPFACYLEKVSLIMTLKLNQLYRAKVRFIPEAPPGTLLFYLGRDSNPYDGLERLYFENARTKQGYTWATDYQNINQVANFLEEVVQPSSN